MSTQPLLGTALSILSPQPGLTMSSREIAELCEKEHKNVLADIRKMLGELGQAAADFSATAMTAGPNGSMRQTVVYNLPWHETMVLITGYSVQLRSKVIARWQELEENLEIPGDSPLLPSQFTYYSGRVLRVEFIEDGTFLFNWVDLCAMLGHNNPTAAAHRYVDRKDVTLVKVRTAGGRQLMTHVTAVGALEGIIRSSTQQANAIKRWMVSDVLPQLRGEYEPPLALTHQSEQAELFEGSVAEPKLYSPDNMRELDLLRKLEVAQAKLIKAQEVLLRRAAATDSVSQ